MKGTMLIVDDEANITVSLANHFRFLGYEVETATNGLDALQILGERKMNVVISDIVMPKMDGLDLLRAIRGAHPMVRVIMITGYATMEHALTCMRLQADTIVFKPIEDISELEGAVDRAFQYITLWQGKLLELRNRGFGKERG